MRSRAARVEPFPGRDVRQSDPIVQVNLVMVPLQAMKEGSDFDDARLALLFAKAKSLSELLEEKVRAFEFRKEHGMLPDQQQEED
ncbi:hypothetical protein [Mesorhizobium sp. CA5]|uniref:hypothetical protein n=1 Tax=Mesorhizobium sp. CA5 TaxID=2876638 RepID=UPI001CD090D9|nr:hypothetical protein [Mesorhizobium sp. CA5]MBZ9841933.1 hypothetical protein [Mesorhizobium sp. CA5]